MTGSFSVKLKLKKGSVIITDLNSNTTIGDLKARIAAVTEVKESNLHILVGYPPRPLDLSQSAMSLGSSGISGGDTLIVEEKLNAAVSINIEKNSANVNVAPASHIDDELLARSLQAEEEERQLREVVAESTREHPPPPPITLSATRTGGNGSGNFDGILLKKVVPADNSCLFTSIRFVLKGKIDNEGSEMMRHIIAQQVAADPQQYNDAILGKSNAEYCSWIQKSDSWGGAIEVAILSSYYGIEIDVVDIQNAIINRFGEDKNYGLRVFLLFDGIHYDPLYMETETAGTPATIFPIEEMGIYQQAEQLANEAKSSRQFTNVDKFSLRCLQCNDTLVGQVAAQKHAKTTGHTNFGEI